MVVVGFFFKKNPREPTLPIEEVIVDELIKPREALLNMFSDGSRVILKTMFKVETRFKTVNLILNMHFLDDVS
jgi:hypothetical protein